MPTKTIYFDESGFTGYNLLDKDQPIFVIAGTDIDSTTAKTILNESFPNYQGAEFKFKNIWRSNKTKFINFGKHIGDISDHVLVWMMDKQFVVLTKIVDFLIEPNITNCGYDFYADGFCWKYTNYIHFGLIQYAPPELYTSLTTAYQNFSRNPSRKQLRNLQTTLSIMAKSSEESVRIFLEQMLLGVETFDNYHKLQTFKQSNETQASSMLATVIDWRKRYLEDFELIHDASSNFFRQQEIWEKITGKNVPAQLHPLGDGTFVQFPLRVISTTSTDSKDHCQIQFCDILAGLIARQFDWHIDGDDRKLLDEVIDAGLDKINVNGIHPSPVFPDRIPPRPLDGPDAVDKMTQIIFPKKL